MHHHSSDRLRSSEEKRGHDRLHETRDLGECRFLCEVDWTQSPFVPSVWPLTIDQMTAIVRNADGRRLRYTDPI